MLLKRKLLVSAAGLMLAAAGTPGLVLAQTSSTPQTPAPPSPASDKNSTTVGELVVTGSHLKHTQYNTPAPVQIITTDDSKLEGLIDPTAILQGSTAAAGYSQINQQFGQYVVNGGPGADTIGLRGLGSQRTLVLLNGRRLNPAGVSGTVADVDLNVIPDALVDRYEVLKDGASSIYGSDAIGGVINIITRDKFDGLNISTSDSIPQEGAGNIYEVSLTGGRVRDNYHILFGLQYHQEDRIRIKDLPGGACPSDLEQLPTGGGYTSNRSYANGAPYCANTQTDYLTDYSTGLTWVLDANQPANMPYTPFVQDDFGVTPRITNIATDPRTADVDAYSPVQRTAFTLLGGVDLPHNTEFYFEDLVTNRRSQQAAYLPELFPASFSDAVNVSISPFNPFQGDLVVPVTTLPVQNFSQDVWAGRFLFGLRGDFGSLLKGWTWDTSLIYGFSRATYIDHPLLTSKVENALNVVPYTGQPGVTSSEVRTSPVDGMPYTCAIDVTDPGEGCYPVNFFESYTALASDPALKYMRTTERGRTDYDQVVLDATANGPVFKLPAGELMGVVGLEARYDKLYDNPGPDSINQNIFNESTAGITQGDDDVVEVYAEAEAPIVKGVPGIDQLTLNLSGRFTDYKTGGSDFTYKVGANWQIIPSLRIRATYGTSFRGPALYENYLASQTSFSEAQDPCYQYQQDDPSSNLYKNCATALAGVHQTAPLWPGYSSTPEVLTQGAQGRLKSETSKNLTVGPVWQPSFADLQVSIDYFRIEVDNEIARLGDVNILNLCYDSAQFYNGSPYCTLVSPRDSQGDIALINDSYLNISEQIISGVDVSARYQNKFSFGRLILDAEVTRAFEDNQELFPGAGFTNFTGTFGEPRWVGDGEMRFKRGDWEFVYTVNYLGDQNEYGLTGETPGGRYLEYQAAQFYHSLSVMYEADKWKVIFGVRDILNSYPPVISNNPDTAYAPRVGEFTNGYGNLNLYGRTFFVSLSKDF